MAACNAVFWDAERKRWDGSEEIMVRSRGWITKMPEKPHVRFLSASSFTTLVLTEQGAQMIYLIAQGYIRGSRHVRLGLPGVFAGLQLLGLIRLFAALWLSSDYSYMNLRGSGLGSEISETPLEKQVRETYSKLVSATTYWRLMSEIVSFPFIAGRASFTGHFGSRRSGVSWGRLPEPVPRSSGTIPQDFHMIHHRTWCGGSCTLLCHFSVF
jgi:hypothetical protein